MENIIKQEVYNIKTIFVAYSQNVFCFGRQKRQFLQF